MTFGMNVGFRPPPPPPKGIQGQVGGQFRPPGRPQFGGPQQGGFPPPPQGQQGQNPMDRMILGLMKAVGIKPSGDKQADMAKLIEKMSQVNEQNQTTNQSKFSITA